MAGASEDAMGGADTLLMVGTHFPYTKQAKLSSKGTVALVDRRARAEARRP